MHIYQSVEKLLTQKYFTDKYRPMWETEHSKPTQESPRQFFSPWSHHSLPTLLNDCLHNGSELIESWVFNLVVMKDP